MAERIEHLVLATHNPGKLVEIRALLDPFSVSVSSAGERGVEEPEETGDSFIANALLKAHHSAKATNLPALADDSGLAVPALGGAPGIYSARWAGPTKDFALAIERVRTELGDKDPAAYFVAALAVAWPDGREIVFEGRIDGHLEFPPRGSRGFGYDPIFVPEGDSRTFGEYDPAEKHAISHRARAFKQLVARLFER